MKPTKPEHFIGKTGQIARVLFGAIPKLQSEPHLDARSRCYLFTGPPGTGKSSLAELFALALAGSKFAVEQVNGQSCTVDKVRAWSQQGGYIPLYGKVVVQLVDEIDAASLAACNELRTYLDKLPPHTVFIATTNKPVAELQEQLQSRFKVHYFERVPAEQISAWLADKFEMPAHQANRIAAGCKGNVRAAECDALAIQEVEALA